MSFWNFFKAVYFRECIPFWTTEKRNDLLTMILRNLGHKAASEPLFSQIQKVAAAVPHCNNCCQSLSFFHRFYGGDNSSTPRVLETNTQDPIFENFDPYFSNNLLFPHSRFSHLFCVFSETGSSILTLLFFKHFWNCNWRLVRIYWYVSQGWVLELFFLLPKFILAYFGVQLPF